MSGSTVIIIPPDGSMRRTSNHCAGCANCRLAALAPGHGARHAECLAEIERVIGHRLAREDKLVRALERRGAATLDEVLAEVYDDVPKFMHVYARYSLLAHAREAGGGGARGLDGELYRWRGD